ncbi:MAG: hypothetical protein EU550_01935 [Promethearchaeota archaeon]|nr:MAG: hypothetical protein EU550_01935 [Candidatus Lokiarchaeota archaeon]
MMTNKKKIPFIRIQKKNAETFINIIKKSDLIEINKKFLPQKTSNYVFFPIKEIPSECDESYLSFRNQLNFEVIWKKPIQDPNYKFKTIQNALEGEIPNKYFQFIPKSFDVVGEIAIIEFNKDIQDIEESSKLKCEIAKALTLVNKNITTVFEKASGIRGNYRRRQLNLLCGEETYETEYKENNCNFKLDIRKTFFTPRMVNERLRISSLKYKENELIFDLFAGVGTFSIQIARLHNVNIYAFDINPYAYSYLYQNIRANKSKGKVFPFNLNVKNLIVDKNILNFFKNKIDRVIMNLPETSLNFMDVTCTLLKKNSGILHLYQFCEKENSIEIALGKLESILLKYQYKITKVFNKKVVKAYSPSHDMIGIDALIEEDKK